MPISVLDKGHNCSNCRFSRPVDHTDKYLVCQYSPPRLTSVDSYEQPAVMHNSWCGQWLAVVSERFTFKALTEEAA